MAHGSPRVVLVGVDPWLEDAPDFRPFNYGVHRVRAALTDPPGEGDVHLVEARRDATADLADRVVALDPDVVGLSAYVWSLPHLWPVARAVRAARPDAWIILGGPCARPEMMALSPYADAPRPIDALVAGAGEDPMRRIVRARARGERLSSVPDLLVPDGAGYRKTLGRSTVSALSDAPSPFQLGIAPAGVTGHLLRFSGCPLSCSFCQWGEMGASDVLTTEFLIRELSAYRASGARGVMIVDAGLNLHATAFKNLRAAEDAVGFLKESSLHCEIYPRALLDEHLEFLSGVRANIGVGLQSYDQKVLSVVERHARVEDFESLVRRIGAVAEPTIEMILGLPGDSPASFRASFERARRLPFSLRVYQCLVLPDALMTRGDPSFALDYDPVTLVMRSCLGWSADDLRREADWLSDRIGQEGGFSGYTWWHFRPASSTPGGPRGRAPRSPARADGSPPPRGEAHRRGGS